MRQAGAAVAQAQATRDRATTEVSRVQFLFDRGIKAKRELDDAQTALRVADANLQSAQDALSLVQAGTRPEDIRAGELRVSGAREAVQAARASGDAKVVGAQAALQLAQSNLGQVAQLRPEDVRAAALRVQSARDAVRQALQNGDAKVAGARAALQAASQGAVQIAARVQDARSKQALAASKRADLQSPRIAASSSELRAPLAGIVSRRLLNPGDMADPASPVVEISNSSTLNLLANLSGEVGAGVQQGMTARVSTSGAPNRVFRGQVVSVGQIDPQTNLLSVRIAVPNPNGQLKVGAFASADIVLSTKPLAVVVPKTALLSRNGKSAVLVAGSDGKAHQRTVATGIQRGGTVEIASGIGRREEKATLEDVMGAPYSCDLRQRVLAALDGGMSKMAAHKMFCVSRSTIDDWLLLRASTGSVHAKSGYQKGRTRALGEATTFEAFAVRHAHKTLEQMAGAWKDEIGQQVSRNTFSVALRQLGWTHKKRVGFMPSETNTSETNTSEMNTSEMNTSEMNTSEMNTSETNTSETNTSEMNTSETSSRAP